jgi:FMN phosphatase YigB (HAD superfamily)
VRTVLHPGQEIRAVLFDLGGTLIDGRDFSGWAEDCSTLGLPATPESIASAWEAVRPWENHREGSPEELWTEVLSRASTASVSPGSVARFIELQRAKPIYGALFSDVRRCLDRLRRDRKRLGIVSNSRSEPAVRGLLGVLDIETVFEVVVSSGTEGIRKPNPEIFRRALERIGAGPEATLFVGDDVVNDVRGATEAGLHAVLINRMGTGLEGDWREVLSLSEVPRIIRLIEGGAPVK